MAERLVHRITHTYVKFYPGVLEQKAGRLDLEALKAANYKTCFDLRPEETEEIPEGDIVKFKKGVTQSTIFEKEPQESDFTKVGEELQDGNFTKDKITKSFARKGNIDQEKATKVKIPTTNDPGKFAAKNFQLSV